MRKPLGKSGSKSEGTQDNTGQTPALLLLHHRMLGAEQLRTPRRLGTLGVEVSRISYDPTRYPKYLPEAYCLCRGCLTGPFGEEDLRFRSVPVLMPTVVLRRTAACAGGRYLYAEDYVAVAVGCTCVPEQEKEQEKDAEGINSSMDKQAAKLLLGANDQPAAP
ncbi:interleukin-17D isoform X3 [Elephas maximus indicus]|uniref:interleukin-17D isoform X3 n=1 Tax=Elephas maximus indicus TaxID=99487 RepID=UPI002116E124|nr:interleukin-17D isoform X3 [Elephas maximus indicus]